jgi:hypothetical protein
MYAHEAIFHILTIMRKKQNTDDFNPYPANVENRVTS